VKFGLWLMFGWGCRPSLAHVKLGFVVLLLIYHMLCFKLMRDFRARKTPMAPASTRLFTRCGAAAAGDLFWWC